MWIPGVIISYLTGGQDFNGFNVQLLSPLARHLVPKKIRHTELKIIKNEIDRELNGKHEMTELITHDDYKTQIH